MGYYKSDQPRKGSLTDQVCMRYYILDHETCIDQGQNHDCDYDARYYFAHPEVTLLLLLLKLGWFLNCFYYQIIIHITLSIIFH